MIGGKASWRAAKLARVVPVKEFTNAAPFVGAFDDRRADFEQRWNKWRELIAQEDPPAPTPPRSAGAEDWAWLNSMAGKLDEDFVDAVREGVAEQERPALEKLFR